MGIAYKHQMLHGDNSTLIKRSSEVLPEPSEHQQAQPVLNVIAATIICIGACDVYFTSLLFYTWKALKVTLPMHPAKEDLEMHGGSVRHLSRSTSSRREASKVLLMCGSRLGHARGH